MNSVAVVHKPACAQCAKRTKQMRGLRNGRLLCSTCYMREWKKRTHKERKTRIYQYGGEA